MLMLLVLCTLLKHISTQDTDVSIFDVLDGNDLTSEEQETLKSNIEQAEVITPSELTTPNSSDEETLSLEELEAINSELLSEKEDLSKQLNDSYAKIESYIKGINEINKIIETNITNLRDYNHKIIRDQMEAEAAAKAAKEAAGDEKDDEEDEDDENDFSIVIIFVMSIGFVFLLLQGLRSLFGVSVQSFLNPAFYSLFIDVTILLIICSLLSLGDYADVFDSDIIDYSILLIGVALFTFFWLFLGLWFIIAAQSFSKTWLRHEKSCQDLRNLTHLFQEVNIEIVNGSVPRRVKAIYKEIQYAIMRQLFICPVYLPPVTETYLRTDFNLAEYLSRCIADTVNKIFQLN